MLLSSVARSGVLPASDDFLACGLVMTDSFQGFPDATHKAPTALFLHLPTGEKVRRVVRPRFRALLSFLARGGAEVMIAYDLDRAVRDPRDLEDLIDAKVLYGFRVLSTTGSLRLDNDSDIAMARVAMANKSSADTARRIEAKTAERQEAQREAVGRERQLSEPFKYDPHRHETGREDPPRGL